MGLYFFPPIIPILLSDKNMREWRSKTKSKNWEKCSQTSLVLINIHIFTQDFCNLWFFYMSVLIADPNFEFSTQIVKGIPFFQRQLNFQF